MTFQMVLDLVHKTLTTALIAAAPMLGTALLMGVVVNIIQTVTQIRDTSVTFVPKAVAAAVALVVFLPWGMGVLVEFSAEMFRMMSQISH